MRLAIATTGGLPVFTGFIRKQLAIPDREVTFLTRGFRPAPDENRLRLESIGRTFVEGYHSALELRDGQLERRLAEVRLEDRGFAFEGAAMAIAIQDAMLPFRRPLRAWLAGPGRPHEYMTYVGAGWAIARIPWQRARAEKRARELHPFLWPLTIDGYGFHQGYFHATRLADVSHPNGLHTQAARSAYDQGLGRSFWFVAGADPHAAAGLIAEFDALRRSDLWSGVGLACAYAGAASAEAIRVLARIAGAFAPALGQGACFAAKARERAGNPAAHTDMACRRLCGMSAAEAARLSQDTYQEIVRENGTYADWRQLLQSRLDRESALTE